MSAGNNLQEMENVVTKGAAPAEPMNAAGIPVEDLGGPTPENSRPDDDSNALRTPGATLKQVQNVVNMRAARAEEVEVDEDQEEIEEGAPSLIKSGIRTLKNATKAGSESEGKKEKSQMKKTQMQEEEFETEIPDEDAEKITSVQEAIDYVNSNQ